MSAWVYGWAVFCQQLLRLSQLDDLSQVHDGDVRGHIGHHGQVVPDQQVTEFQVLLQIHQEVNDLQADGDVQRGRGFVEDDDLRVRGNGPGDGHALPLASAQFVRVDLYQSGVQTHRSQRFQSFRFQLFPAQIAGNLQGLRDDLPDPETGAQRGERVLKDRLNRAAVGLQFRTDQGMDVLPFVEHLPVCRLFKQQQCLGKGGLSASGLSHHPQNLPRFDRQIDTVQGLDPSDHMVQYDPGLDREMHLEITDLEQIIEFRFFHRLFFSLS